MSLEVISEEKTSCEPNGLLHTQYQQILTLDSISLQHIAPSAHGGEEGDDSNTFCSKIPANTQAGFSDREGSPPVTRTCYKSIYLGFLTLETISLKSTEESLNA